MLIDDGVKPNFSRYLCHTRKRIQLSFWPGIGQNPETGRLLHAIRSTGSRGQARGTMKKTAGREDENENRGKTRKVVERRKRIIG
jgi:hypothetical protein